MIQDLNRPRQVSFLDALDSTSDGTTHEPDVLSLNPLDLPQQNTEFWRQKFTDVGSSAFYFVSDAAVPVVLYVGETGQANSRWKGEHDCKRYLMNYVELHRRYELPVTVQIGFYPEAPEETRARQQLEQSLIQIWRSPFNKENWQHWGKPFGAD
ncbi:MAG: GIY-YIG nuclease family protein [Acaryochloridaceae cyanobacterium RL_2_7]|nr:GIY-YIG nuclease family protein [Acaryochloridaceae cyanobacterium RL_2_7]